MKQNERVKKTSQDILDEIEQEGVMKEEAQKLDLTHSTVAKLLAKAIIRQQNSSLNSDNKGVKL